DVIVHLDVFACGAEDAGSRVAQHRVAHVADVRGLVRIDRGVFDDHFARSGLPALRLRADQLREYSGAIQKDVQVTRACDFDSRDAEHRGQAFSQLRRKFARVLLLAGRGLDALGQIE